MPRKNGLQVVQELEGLYEAWQAQLPETVKLQRPTIIFLTAFATTQFRNHVLSYGV